MCHCSESRLTPQAIQVVGYFVGVELSIVVKYHCSGDAEASDDVFSNELSHFHDGHGGDNFRLYPLSEVIKSQKEILVLGGCSGKRSQNVHPPCGEGQGAKDAGKWGRWLPLHY